MNNFISKLNEEFTHQSDEIFINLIKIEKICGNEGGNYDVGGGDEIEYCFDGTKPYNETSSTTIKMCIKLMKKDVCENHGENTIFLESDKSQFFTDLELLYVSIISSKFLLLTDNSIINYSDSLNSTRINQCDDPQKCFSGSTVQSQHSYSIQGIKQQNSYILNSKITVRHPRTVNDLHRKIYLGYLENNEIRYGSKMSRSDREYQSECRSSYCLSICDGYSTEPSMCYTGLSILNGLTSSSSFFSLIVYTGESGWEASTALSLMKYCSFVRLI